MVHSFVIRYSLFDIRHSSGFTVSAFHPFTLSSFRTPMLDALPITPLAYPVSATVRVPGSKSLTNRALLVAALAHAPPTTHQPPTAAASTLHNALRSDDTERMVGGLRALGVQVEADWPTSRLTVWGCGGRMTARADLFLGNSGTSMRFLTAMVSLGRGHYRLDGDPRMQERPIEDLLAALRQLGVKAWTENGNGCPPVIVEADGLRGGRVSIRGSTSSQFLSGLLMVAPLAQTDVTVEIDGPLVSRPYVDMTIEVMRQFGAEVQGEQKGVGTLLCEAPDGPFRQKGPDTFFRVAAPQRYVAHEFHIEPDASAASYFFGAAAVTGSVVTVPGLTTRSLQGDTRFVAILEDMGCRVIRADSSITVRGGPLHGVDVDMNDISDCVMTLAVVACFAEGKTTIRNVRHIRHKETDRLAALATELRRIGATVEEFADGLTVIPRPLHGAAIETYNDHRMAMSLALVGLKVPGLTIRNPHCVAKTYPAFFEDLRQLQGAPRVVGSS
jgi:3-phosphoshikimate 1-carboxyvinyltransferase